jgi:acyl-coenzyme A thioesterase PaaI-like protein
MAWGTIETYCFGCTPDHRTGLRLAPAFDGDVARAPWTPTHEHEGPPGLAHGGLIMAALDEVMTLLTRHGLNGYWVTGTLTVRLLAGLPVEQQHTVEARVDRVDGRKAFLSGRVVAADGSTAAEAEGIWIETPDAGAAAP